MRVLMPFLDLGLWHRYRRQLIEVAERCEEFVVYYRRGEPPDEDLVLFTDSVRVALGAPVDVVYCLSAEWPQLYGLLFSLVHRVPLVIRMRGDARRLDEILGRPWYRLLVKTVIRRLSFWHASAVVPIAGHLSEVARSQWARRVTEPVANGVDLDHFKPGPMPEEFTVGYVGRDSPEKNFEFVKALEEAMPYDRFIVAMGDVPYSEMPDFYNRCSVIVLPSLMEGFSNVLLEAYACGRNVICSPEACPPELYAYIVPTLVYRWQNALKLRHLLDPRALVIKYTWERYANGIMKVLHDAIRCDSR